MLWFLRFLFIAVLGSMLWVTSWASMRGSILAIPRDVFTHPWFIATLFDAYFGFVTFYVWQAWKEQSLAGRVLWFIAVMLLGNLAMSIYLLAELFRINKSAQLAEVISRRNPGRLMLPGALVAASIGIYLLA
jgi:predicted permease